MTASAPRLLRPSPGPTAGHSPRPGRRQGLLAWAFPLVVVAAVALLTALDLNGTSVALNGPDWRSDPSLVAGTPRSIRSDEFGISTPLAVGNDRRGLPVTPQVGLNEVDLPATSLGVPSAHWTTAFKPYEWGFFVLDTSHAVALRWWSLIAIGLLGAFALVRVLTGSVPLAVGASLVVACTPYSGWWSLTPALVVGLAAAGTACAVRALTPGRPGGHGLLAATAWGAAAGWFVVALALVLYPPWVVSVALVGVAVVAGAALDRRPGPARVAVAAGTAIAVVLPSLGAWYVGAREAIAATTATYYPGNRISDAGGGSLAWLMDTPSSLWLSLGSMRVAPSDVTATGEPLPLANASEVASTWVPAPLLAVALAVLAWLVVSGRRSPADDTADGSDGWSADPVDGGPGSTADMREQPPVLWTAVLVSAATLLLLAWALLPLPDVVGRLTLLDRVPGRRTPQAIGFGALLVLALVGTALRRVRAPWWLAAGLAAGGIATVTAHVWAVGALRWVDREPGPGGVTLVALVVTAGFATMLGGRFVAAGALVAGGVSLVIFAVVNPLYRGLGPIASDPVVRALRPYAGADPARVAVFDGNPAQLLALVSASGVENLSGLTAYPDRELWERLAPAQERAWNNWSKYAWIPDPSADPVRIEGWRGTYQRLYVNVCAPEIRELGLDVALSTSPMRGWPCLRHAGSIPRAGTTLYVYRYR